MSERPAVLSRDSLRERTARQRCLALLDLGARELLGPFDRLESPWLAPQGVVPESDDGVVVVLGALGGRRTVAIGIEQAFQGGGIGEVSGAKIATALRLAARDSAAGTPTAAVLLLETGGVRLQEANLGLGAVAEICDAVLELRARQPVIGLIVGPLGSFGGMSIAAGLCSHLFSTREGRLGLNGPEVIESEAGIAEFDSHDRGLVWSVTGGAAREAAGLVDALVPDDVGAVRDVLASALAAGVPPLPRSRDLARLQELADRAATGEPATGPRGEAASAPGRGSAWTSALADGPGTARVPSVRSAPATVAGHPARLLTVVADPDARFHRARHGEVGLAEGLALAQELAEIVHDDRSRSRKRAVIAVVDLPSQAYGRTEETAGLHQFLAAAVDAYTAARAAGHPVVALVVGTALSGGFLAHGLAADRILALDDPGVEIHAMHKPAAARITRRTVAELDELARRIPPLSYDVHSWMSLGIGERLVAVDRPDDPTPVDVAGVRAALDAAVTDARRDPADLSRRLDTPGALTTRTASRAVRDLLGTQWEAAENETQPGGAR